jgi:glyoxylase-like metal-dependent hydrolase (beta-lactamase superfamily II)
MNKNLRLFFVLFFCVLFASLPFSQAQDILPVKIKVISGEIYEILEGRGARGGAYIGSNGILLIDSKMDKKSVDETIEGIKKLTDKPIKYLMNTHSDADHIDGNQYFPETVNFIAHENCRKEFFHPKRDGTPSDWNKPDLIPFLPAITFLNRMDLYLGSKKIELWYFGVGHTTGDAVVYFREEKIAFIGDQVFLERPQLIHSYKGGNSFEHVKTLKKMLETLDAEKFCSGHSEIADRKTIDKHIADMEERQQKVKSLIGKNKTLEEIGAEFPKNETILIETIYNEIKRSN